MELIGAIMLVLPLFFVMMYLCWEASMYIYLKTGVDMAARVEARWLGINFPYLCQDGLGGKFDSSNSLDPTYAQYTEWINPNITVANCVKATPIKTANAGNASSSTFKQWTLGVMSSTTSSPPYDTSFQKTAPKYTSPGNCGGNIPANIGNVAVKCEYPGAQASTNFVNWPQCPIWMYNTGLVPTSGYKIVGTAVANIEY